MFFKHITYEKSVLSPTVSLLLPLLITHPYFYADSTAILFLHFLYFHV